MNKFTRMKHFLSIFWVQLVFFAPLICVAQTYDYGFERDFSISVRDTSLQIFEKAWVGGLNACHFNEIDFDFDGDKDMVVFDKAGDKLLCFQNNGSSGITSYIYAPEFEYLFPPVEGWIQMKDYNCDGKEDIFAYAPAGMQVWKNISDTVLKFQLMTPLLNSWQGVGYSNIGLTSVDFPGIADIDGDGDLDILVFFGLGAYVQLHRNNSMEQFGNCDSLLYERTYNCWGDFAESSSTNHIILNIDCPWKCQETPDDADPLIKEAKHTGSTMLLLDMNNDSLLDLVLGDVDYMNLILLTNGGTTDSAHILSADSLFPSGSLAVNIVAFPVSSYVDINNDSIRELLVSPFDPNPVIPESFNSVWYYENNGTNTAPIFNYQSNNFLQGEMIDVGTGAYPVLFDYDDDGINDLIVSNYGYLDSTYYEFGFLKTRFRSKLALFKNTGTIASPEFTLVSRDFANLSSLGLNALAPAFSDLDGDGDNDMVCGESKGTLLYFENTAGPGNPAVFAAPVSAYQGIDVGEYSFPALADLDGDSLKDLVIGKRNGMLSWYKNTGTSALPVFTHITDTLGKVNVTDYTYSYTGYSTPFIMRDSNGFLKLFVGSERGKIFYYKDIEANLYGKFTAFDSILVYSNSDSICRFINDGMRSGLTIGTLNDDNYPDLICGNFRGGLTCYKGSAPRPYSSTEEYKISEKQALINVFPNPANERLWVSAVNIPIGNSMLIRFFNINGHLIMESPLQAGILNNLNIGKLPEGVCFYKISWGQNLNSESSVQNGKIIIIR